jgi:2-polyprenyl-3-methyl-5-hydroxy-6-metoxy-1,4-benzoquinol methylase
MNCNIKEYWDMIYTKELQQGKIRQNSHCYQHILPQIKECQSFLDVGCGTGSFIKFLKLQDVISENIWGVDISDVAQDYCLLEYNVEVYRNVFDIQFKRDMVTCFHTLEHLENPEEIIEYLYNHCSIKYLIFAIPLNDGEWREHIQNFTVESIKEIFSKYPNVRYFKSAMNIPQIKPELIVVVRK